MENGNVALTLKKHQFLRERDMATGNICNILNVPKMMNATLQSFPKRTNIRINEEKTVKINGLKICKRLHTKRRIPNVTKPTNRYSGISGTLKRIFTLERMDTQDFLSKHEK